MKNFNMKVRILKKLRRKAGRIVTFKTCVEKVDGVYRIFYVVRWRKNRARRFIYDGSLDSADNAMEFYEKKKREIFEHLFWYHYKRETVFPRI